MKKIKIITIISIFILIMIVATNTTIYFYNKNLLNKTEIYIKVKNEYDTLTSEIALYQTILNETLTLEENKLQLDQKVKEQETRINSLNNEIEATTNKIKELKK